MSLAFDAKIFAGIREGPAASRCFSLILAEEHSRHRRDVALSTRIGSKSSRVLPAPKPSFCFFCQLRMPTGASGSSRAPCSIMLLPFLRTGIILGLITQCAQIEISRVHLPLATHALILRALSSSCHCLFCQRKRRPASVRACG